MQWKRFVLKLRVQNALPRINLPQKLDFKPFFAKIYSFFGR